MFKHKNLGQIVQPCKQAKHGGFFNTHFKAKLKFLWEKSQIDFTSKSSPYLIRVMCIYEYMCLRLCVCVPSVSQTAAPSVVGQRRVSILRLPSCRSWGSARRALQVYLTLCSCLAPIWVTLTGYQGVHGVVRLTSAHASKLHALYSWMQ